MSKDRLLSLVVDAAAAKDGAAKADKQEKLLRLSVASENAARAAEEAILAANEAALAQKTTQEAHKRAVEAYAALERARSELVI